MEQYGERYVERYSALDILKMAYEELTQTQTEEAMLEAMLESDVVLQENSQ